MPSSPHEFDRNEVDLNRTCFCITLDDAALKAALRAELVESPALVSDLENRSHLFSANPVFLSEDDLAAMMAVIAAIEAAASNKIYRDAVMAWAPPVAHPDFGPRGVFMGYDFHLGEDGPKLIEVNTNAGGAFLNALLARAQASCCQEANSGARGAALGEFEANVWRMFLAEWGLQGRKVQPSTVAIVDDHPDTQYLLPEFLLAQRFFERHGLTAVIVDPGDLSLSEGRLRHGDQVIDLVYNRLVDFGLDEPRHEALREAYLAGSVVMTPNPHNHALFADKRNLTLLSDPEGVRRWGLEPAHAASLSTVPATTVVTHDNAEALWNGRKGYFFKPAGGHGGKAVYRGDKMTRSVWQEVQKGGYIAQAVVKPSERRIRIDGEPKSFKLDVRVYTYDGTALLTAARIYQGQTTNFRTPGGGFAPIFVI
jgi:glutathione synthase/RimK-type ligase-like ATP-grasp enzyme